MPPASNIARPLSVQMGRMFVLLGRRLRREEARGIPAGLPGAEPGMLGTLPFHSDGPPPRSEARAPVVRKKTPPRGANAAGVAYSGRPDRYKSSRSGGWARCAGRGELLASARRIG